MRRNALNGICHDILMSFISRNNDLSGYWGIGMLCLAASENNTQSVALDLLNNKASLISNEFDAMVNHYREMLFMLLGKRSIPASAISKVTLVTSFNQGNDERYHYFQSALGQPYICTIEMFDTLGRGHSITAGGHCKSHDPSKESRRAPDKRIE
ncbi:hypothetical protein [Sapientia aquatica]|uniref:Uncharacterized protein n=1 Tax=Sapientia aquatica TaxID=1549640 RepID=A0A4R5W230_9BURK|nr:hypothetical protein [Sapientia aquatica]TDK66393.1 hypothetical protein E2I14_07925 [Sapientia aquatica]